MQLEAAKNVAWIESRKHKQDMFVVEKRNTYFAASTLDLSRQFQGCRIVFEYKQ